MNPSLSSLEMQIWAVRHIPRFRTKPIAKISIPLSDLLQVRTNTCSLTITYPKKSAGQLCQLYVTAAQITQQQEQEHVQSEVANVIANPMGSAPQAITLIGDAAVSDGQSV
ncbi:hypothetical protein FA95DRAFT_1560270 [Auriscalpium vulgare]|uniref:Uncharacterized protein n=1 Tax=Auriscalpium vulgare TaxID=40419 RepID=A0ACB8RRW5_9AGAM|nr:hypothetical protein FA95DRAFT_1560270 [Auriscalpium vulgare]